MFALWAPRLPLTTKRVVRALGVYMLLAFGLRPLYLIIAQPQAAYNEPLANPMLLAPTYWAGVTTCAGLVLLGFAGTLAVVYAGASLARGRKPRAVNEPRDVLPILWIIWLLAWLSRLLLLSHLVTLGAGLGLVAGRMLSVGVVALGIAILTTDWRHNRNMRQFVIAAVLGEIAWSALDASKTPLLAAMLFFYVDPRRPRLSVRLFSGITVGVIGAFTLIQQLKQTYSGAAESLKPLWLRATDTILLRFDMLNAVALARHAGSGSYMSWSKAIQRMLVDWIPQQLVGVSRLSDGQNWAIVMQHTYSGVALATGPAAEGYAIGGMLGIVVFGALSGAALVLCAALLDRGSGLALGSVVVYVIASGALFEQGALGIIDTVSGGLQVCVVVVAVSMLIRSPAATGGLHSKRERRHSLAVSPVEDAATGGLVSGRRSS
jgi:hypothetical protein